MRIDAIPVHSTIGTLIPHEGGGWDVVRRFTIGRGEDTTTIGTAPTAGEALELLHEYRKKHNLSLWPYIPKTQYRSLVFEELMQARCQKCGELKPIGEFSTARPSFCRECLKNAKFKGKRDKEAGVRMAIAKELLNVNERIAKDFLEGKRIRPEGYRSPHLTCDELTRQIFRELRNSHQLEYCKNFSTRGIKADVEFIKKVNRYGYAVAIASVIFRNTVSSIGRYLPLLPRPLH